jgi:hypothetical protein
MLMVFVALNAVAAVRAQLECVDAAREAARAEARGGPGETAGRRVAPRGAVVSVTVEGDTVRARVTARVRPLGGRLPGFDITADATALVEPGVADG